MDANTTKTVERVVSRMRKLRCLRGWSQAELGARSGVSSNTVANIETGRRTLGLRLSDALALASALDVPLADLVDPRPLEVALRSEVI
jgi:transcriptional regulator with XRE-family HTH domain